MVVFPYEYLLPRRRVSFVPFLIDLQYNPRCLEDHLAGASRWIIRTATARASLPLSARSRLLDGTFSRTEQER
jgi:hypothetical protein